MGEINNMYMHGFVVVCSNICSASERDIDGIGSSSSRMLMRLRVGVPGRVVHMYIIWCSCCGLVLLRELDGSSG